jgi:RNA recognition motif-containing protein
MPTKIFVGNLDVESTPELEEELRSLFAQFGKVTECAILTGKNFGFVVSKLERKWLNDLSFVNLYFT